MAALDLTSFDSALKVHYVDLRIKNLVYRNHPFLGMVPKMTGFGGKNLPIPIRYGVPQGRSATFSTARANRIASKYKDFILTRKHNYGIAEIDNETMEASVGDVNAFMRAAVSEIDGILMAVANDLAYNLFRSQTGSRARVGAISEAAGETTITLSPVEAVSGFELGMELVAGATDGGSLRAATAYPIVSVDRGAGTIVLTGTAATTSLWAVNDYLYVEGDHHGSSSSALKIAGLDSWLPETAPTSGDSHFQVDRSADTRLSRVFHDGSSETHEEALISAGALLWREGGRPDVVIMNPAHYSNLIKELGSKARYNKVMASGSAEVGFKGVVVDLPTGECTVVSDPDCQTNVAWMLQMDTWKLYSLGEAPKILTYEGNRFLRSSDADSVEVRTGYYGQLGCVAPGWNARVKLPSLT